MAIPTVMWGSEYAIHTDDSNTVVARDDLWTVTIATGSAAKVATAAAVIETVRDRPTSGQMDVMVWPDDRPRINQKPKTAAGTIRPRKA
jgi:hypothetical protein